jgi:hypothetical protein
MTAPLSRRQSLGVLGGAVVSFSTLTRGLEHAFGLALHQPLDPKALQVLRQRTDVALSGIVHKPAEYANLFKGVRSTLAVERAMQMSSVPLGSPRRDFDTLGQVFVWNGVAKEIGLAFAVTGRNKDGAPVTNKELCDQAQALADTHLLVRERLAAALFNYALDYDPEVGGDGQPLLSTDHPILDDGPTWANTFPEHRPLALESFKDAVDIIKGKFVDQCGLKIHARPKMLVVPKEAREQALEITARYAAERGEARLPVLPYSHLEDPDSWYILTSIDGFVQLTRVPFETGTWVDHQHGCILAKGYERHCFVCNDPRAVFGSMKLKKKRPYVLDVDLENDIGPLPNWKKPVHDMIGAAA